MLLTFSVRRKMMKCGKGFDTMRYTIEDKKHLSFIAMMAKYVAHKERNKARAATIPQALGVAPTAMDNILVVHVALLSLQFLDILARR